MNLTEARVNEIVDDLVERGILIARNDADVTSSLAWRDAVSAAPGRTTTERIKAAAAAVGFEFPTCCVDEYAYVLAYMSVKERCQAMPHEDDVEACPPGMGRGLGADGLLRV